MSNGIDLGELSERELLLQVAFSCNKMEDQLSAINGYVRDHESRLVHLETTQDIIKCNTGIGTKGKLIAGGSGATTIIGGTIFGVGKLAGWW